VAAAAKRIETTDMSDKTHIPLNVLATNGKVEELKRDTTPISPIAPRASGGALEDTIVAALRTIFDPEIPLNIYDLGLIYGIDVASDNSVKVTMTLTAPGCPVAGEIVAQVERKVREVEAVSSAKVDLVFDPPWSRDRMSEAALLELGLL
jgi:FeS assembly SUF system protein